MCIHNKHLFMKQKAFTKKTLNEPEKCNVNFENEIPLFKWIHLCKEPLFQVLSNRYTILIYLIFCAFPLLMSYKDRIPCFTLQPAQSTTWQWELQLGEDGCLLKQALCVWFNSHQSCTRSYNPGWSLWTHQVSRTVPPLRATSRTRMWWSLVLWGLWLL